MKRNSYAISWDELLSAGAFWLFKAALFILSSVLFVLAIWALPTTVFPNDAGWHDLSNMEILFLTGFTLLTVRYITKVKKHSAKVGRAVYRYLTAIGIHTFVFISAALLLSELSPDSAQPLLSSHQEYWSLAYEISLLLLLFAIAPKGKFNTPKTTSVIPPSETPTLTDEKKNHG
ncbi:hypothetical protein CWE24_12370 [Pseudidiomarina donghaiensis]|uniref:Uncharacterized protein n=1 Tax=Pseudidiomarina donghaiensis TaxID=519452 RepID=A0A432XB23_9GAMM|nr:hypothetical protein CWE24_12370 [Pseudidiomarina donghaiensis]SFV25093.1 hypothetical protein SAMN04488139_0078 [Pseudidiomarina donghaiensis]